MGERHLGVRPDDLLQRGYHGDALVGEVAELLLERAEPLPAYLIEIHRPVGREGSESIACVGGIRGIHGRLHRAQEIPEWSGRVSDYVPELVEDALVDLCGLRFLGWRRHGSFGLGHAYQSQLFRVADGLFERELLVESTPERREGVHVILGRLADPVPADEAELAAHELDRVAVIPYLNEDLGRVAGPADDTNS